MLGSAQPAYEPALFRGLGVALELPVSNSSRYAMRIWMMAEDVKTYIRMGRSCSRGAQSTSTSNLVPRLRRLRSPILLYASSFQHAFQRQRRFSVVHLYRRS